LNSILQLNHLHKKYGSIHAVNDLSFSIKKGNVYGILGPNGSRKSTTLEIVFGVVVSKIDHGSNPILPTKYPANL